MKSMLTKLEIGLILIFWLGGCLPGTASNEVPDPTATSRPFLTITPKDDVQVIPKTNRPNILFILTDDLDAELGTANYMPHFQDLLVGRGLTMEDFYVTSPVCCPSRASILRGQYLHNHGVLSNNAPDGGFEKFYYLENESSTLGTWLQAAGYETVLFGKYLNGYPFRENRTYVPVGWTEWYSPAKGQPYVGFDYTLNENGVQVDYRDQKQGESLYLTDVLSRKAVDFINRSAESSAPFFMYLSVFNPHQPAEPATRHAELFPDLTAPRSPSFNEGDVSDKKLGDQFNPLLAEDQISDLDYLYRRRVQSMQAVDEMIVQLVDVLEETGQLENTYIIFTSDNGFHLGQHRLRAGKGTFYEEDIHIPFVIRGPGIAADTTLNGYLTGNVDIAPTIAELAGVIPPAYVDGRSLVEFFDGRPPSPEEWRSAYLLELYGRGEEEEGAEGSIPVVGRYGLRTGDYLYIEYPDGGVELYDMKADPYQLENIASTADPSLLADLSERLHALLSCSGSQCTVLDQDGLKQ